MTELWLPTERLSRVRAADLAPGRLVLLPPSGLSAQPLQIGIRIAAPNRTCVFALSPFFGGVHPRWDAVDLSSEAHATLALDAALSIEADVLAPPERGAVADHRPGDLVATDDGVCIVAAFGRRHVSYKFAGLVSTTTWEMAPDAQVRGIFGGWRLKIDLPGTDPIRWAPGQNS